jgi:hypothetical protein
MGKLESLLPEELKRAAVSSGSELVLPYSEALYAIRVATEHQIAILGLEAFEVQKGGFLTVDYTGYSRWLAPKEAWTAYVTAMNTEAERWIKEHRFGESHGYILTSASQKEFEALRR